jgi:AP-4 complex subunit mu-1
MKTYLLGNPELRLGLNEDLVIGKHSRSGSFYLYHLVCLLNPLFFLKLLYYLWCTGYTATVIDDCNFHESVNTSEFENDRTLIIHPPDGNYYQSI